MLLDCIININIRGIFCVLYYIVTSCSYSGTIGELGTASHSFVLKGIVYVQVDETNKLTKDQALDAAIEAGAEDVVEGFDDYDQPSYQVCQDSCVL